jgi:hypothetical protein
MKNKLLILTLILPLFSFAQKGEEGKVLPITLSGFVKNDMIWDTRQTFSSREGHFLFYPLPEVLDADGEDINDGSNFNFLAVQSRIAVKFNGPDKNDSKFKKSGLIEGDFFGQANDNINLFRLRHAYFLLSSKNLELLFGQYWIPMFIPSCSPGTISFNTGSPIQPFGRNPQARLSLKFGGFNITGIASAHRDNSSVGFGNIRSGSYLSNSGMPQFDVQTTYERDNADARTGLAIGISGGYKKILPSLTTGVTGTNGIKYKSNDYVESYSGMAFMKIKIPEITVKLMGIYGQDISSDLCLGGFAVTDSLDLTRGYVEYSPLTTMSFWAEIHTNGKKVEFGVFGGYTQNLGTVKDIIGPTFGFATNIANLYRVAPRIVLIGEKVKFAFETEYTSATFGTPDSKGVPSIDLSTAANIRYLFAVYYNF